MLQWCYFSLQQINDTLFSALYKAFIVVYDCTTRVDKRLNFFSDFTQITPPDEDENEDCVLFSFVNDGGNIQLRWRFRLTSLDWQSSKKHDKRGKWKTSCTVCKSRRHHIKSTFNNGTWCKCVTLFRNWKCGKLETETIRVNAKETKSSIAQWEVYKFSLHLVLYRAYYDNEMNIFTFL